MNERSPAQRLQRVRRTLTNTAETKAEHRAVHRVCNRADRKIRDALRTASHFPLAWAIFGDARTPGHDWTLERSIGPETQRTWDAVVHRAPKDANGLVAETDT